MGLVGTILLPAAAGAESRQSPVLSFARLSGGQEVPGPGDPDGRGFALIAVDTEAGTICYSVVVARITPATAAHIHEGGRGEAGPVVQGLEPPSAGYSSGCVENAELADEIAGNPRDYYVNVHNEPYPGGAVRGQLR